MSSHRVSTRRFQINIGVDTALNHVFVCLRLNSGKPIPGSGVNETYELSLVGVEDAVARVESQVSKDEPGWKLPSTVITALEIDVLNFHAGLDINSVQVHDS
jgi:hypothetical protein